MKSQLKNTKRLAVGLRNFSRAITDSCKTKQSSDMNEITIIPVLPDVEVITENFDVLASLKKSPKNRTSTSKFITRKFLSTKRKHFKMRRKQLSTNSIDVETESQDRTNENSSTKINYQGTDLERQNELELIMPNNNVKQEGKKSLFP